MLFFVFVTICVYILLVLFGFLLLSLYIFFLSPDRYSVHVKCFIGEFPLWKLVGCFLFSLPQAVPSPILTQTHSVVLFQILFSFFFHSVLFKMFSLSPGHYIIPPTAYVRRRNWLGPVLVRD